MRLLDRVVGSNASMHLALAGRQGVSFEVTAAGRFASSVGGCPLRFVLGDDLTRASAELAFADGERLAGCLDLLRVPASPLWVEWNDEVHKRVIYETRSARSYDAAAAGRRVGMLLRGSPDGFTAAARTFWADAGETAEVTLSPVETLIDLRGGFAAASDIPAMLAGGLAGIADTADEAMSSLLGHVRFRFDDSWAAYYRAAAADGGTQRRVVHASLAAVARGHAAAAGIFSIAVREGCDPFPADFPKRHQSQTAGAWTGAAAGSCRSACVPRRGCARRCGS